MRTYDITVCIEDSGIGAADTVQAVSPRQAILRWLCIDGGFHTHDRVQVDPDGWFTGYVTTRPDSPLHYISGRVQETS